MLLFLASHALAAPSFGVGAGAGVIGGVSAADRQYSSFSPVLAGTVDWRFAWVEVWLGMSGTAFVAPYGDDVVPAALLQGEVGLGLGSRTASAGVFLGAGLSGGEGGLYGRLMFDGPTWAPRLGGEFRAFHLGTVDASGVELLLRAEFGGRLRTPPPAPPPPPPVQHDDPYGA